MLGAMTFAEDAVVGVQAAVDPIAWQAVLARDARFDGVFVYAVRSTGVYCRPSCASRRPRPENVELFASPEDAEGKGFRACLRCRPRDERDADPEVALVLAACRSLGAWDGGDRPTVAELSARVGTNAKGLNRAFRKVLGLTPWQYADAVQVERLKDGLSSGASVTEAMYDAGYSSPSRLYERASRLLGMTPAAYRNGGQGMSVRYAIVDSFAGRVLVAATDRGVCAVHLGDDDASLESGLQAQFPSAEVCRDDGEVRRWAEQVAGLLEATERPADLPLDIQATAFQRAVWEALRNIPHGESRTYGEVAAAIGKPSAVRAVANACASNPVAIVVPCHRVVPASGGSGGYRWGAERKAAMLKHERELARRD